MIASVLSHFGNVVFHHHSHCSHCSWFFVLFFLVIQLIGGTCWHASVDESACPTQSLQWWHFFLFIFLSCSCFHLTWSHVHQSRRLLLWRLLKLFRFEQRRPVTLLDCDEWLFSWKSNCDHCFNVSSFFLRVILNCSSTHVLLFFLNSMCQFRSMLRSICERVLSSAEKDDSVSVHEQTLFRCVRAQHLSRCPWRPSKFREIERILLDLSWFWIAASNICSCVLPAIVQVMWLTFRIKSFVDDVLEHQEQKCSQD